MYVRACMCVYIYVRVDVFIYIAHDVADMGESYHISRRVMSCMCVCLCVYICVYVHIYNLCMMSQR